MLDAELAAKIARLPVLRERGDELQPLLALLPEQAKVAELGSFAGETAVQFLQSPKVLLLLCVDLWQGGYDEKDWASGADMRAAKAAFLARVQPYAKTLIFEDSTLDAARRAVDASYDLVYIDANHGYDAVLADITAWRGKVKPGGLIAGHDYQPDWPGVMRAVDQLFGQPHWTFPDSSWAVRL